VCTGLKVQGAVCKDNVLQLSSTISTDLPFTCVRWVRYDAVAVIAFISRSNMLQNCIATNRLTGFIAALVVFVGLTVSSRQLLE
jgi:peroxiredoxin